MIDRPCDWHTPCDKPDCVDCTHRRVERVLSFAMSKRDPKWSNPGNGPAELAAYQEWLTRTVDDIVAVTRKVVPGVS